MIYTHYDYLDLAPGAPRGAHRGRVCAVLERFQYGAHRAGQDLSGLVRMIHSAYHVLSDPEARRAYDAQLAREARRPTPSSRPSSTRSPRKPARHAQDVPAALRAVLTQLAA